MKNIISISKREILSFFVSPVAYFVITGWMLLCGYFFFNLLAVFSVVVQRYAQMPYAPASGQLNLNQWVVEGYYQTLIVILVFLVPLLTMRIIAEEKRRGTFELLVTSPVSVSEIVTGKFLGVAFVILVMMFGALSFPFLLWAIGEPAPEFYPIISGAIGLTLCALAFAAVGMAVSSFTESQVVAGISSMVALLLLYVIHAPAEALGGVAGQVLERLSPVLEVKDMLRGLVSLQSLVYFISLTFFGLFLSERALEGQRWR